MGPQPDVTMIGTPRGEFGALAVAPPEPRGRPVVLLHGFPDDLSTFGRLQEELASAGRASWSVALRGYRPSTLDGPYDLSSLADDLLAVVDSLPDRAGGAAPVDAVGHDYGGQIVYAATLRAPERFGRAVTLAAPHPNAVLANARRHPRQWWMSRYIVGFQVPCLAEWRMSRSDLRLVDVLWKRWAAPTAQLSQSHLRHVKETIAASMPAPVAMYRGGGFDLPPGTIDVPMRCVLGRADGCLLPEMADGQGDLIREHDLQVLEGCGHFPHHERPDETAALVLDWLD